MKYEKDIDTQLNLFRMIQNSLNLKFYSRNCTLKNNKVVQKLQNRKFGKHGKKTYFEFGPFSMGNKKYFIFGLISLTTARFEYKI